LGETFAQVLAQKPKSAVGSPISSTKIEPSRGPDDHMSHLGKKGLNKKYLNESISNSAKYVTLDSKIKYPSLTFCFLATPPIKLKETYTRGLLVANHWTNQKH
jgi:hypothetical protein